MVEGTDCCEVSSWKELSFPLAVGVRVSAVESGVLVLSAGEVRVSLETPSGCWTVEQTHYSPMYGVIEPNRTVRLRTRNDRVEWSFRLLDGA